MGMHPCAYCDRSPVDHPLYSTSSTGDVCIHFQSPDGEIWKVEFPDMIFHYIWDHLAEVPEKFVEAVMNWKVVKIYRMQTKSIGTHTASIGYDQLFYLDGEFNHALMVDTDFIEKLWQIVAVGLDGSTTRYRKDEYYLKAGDDWKFLVRYIPNGVETVYLPYLGIVARLAWSEKVPPEPKITEILAIDPSVDPELMCRTHGAVRARCFDMPYAERRKLYPENEF